MKAGGDYIGRAFNRDSTIPEGAGPPAHPVPVCRGSPRAAFGPVHQRVVKDRLRARHEDLPVLPEHLRGCGGMRGRGAAVMSASVRGGS